MRQMCQVKLSPDSMRQFNPAHLSLRQFNLARLSHVGGDAAVDGNAQAARSNERGDARKRDGHRSHAANAVHNNEPLGVPHRLFEARAGKAFRDPPSRHLARASIKRAVSNRKLGLLGSPVKTFRLEPRAFFTGEKGDAQRSAAAPLCARCMPTCPECGVRRHFSAGQRKPIPLPNKEVIHGRREEARAWQKRYRGVSAGARLHGAYSCKR